MDREWLKKKYLDEHLTLSEIGEELGCSRQNVWFYIKRYGFSVRDAEWVSFVCDKCGKPSEMTRGKFRKSIKHFCSFDCYREYLRNPEYRQWRHGQRLARLVMEEHLDRKLQTGEVVHYIDSDNMNTSIDNLMVFASNSEHIAFHHKKRQESL